MEVLQALAGALYYGNTEDTWAYGFTVILDQLMEWRAA